MLRKGIFVSVVMLLAILFASGSLMAATYYVRTDGADSNTGLENSSTGAWATVQYAADNATPGDLILIQTGAYPENVVIKTQGMAGVPITLRGEGDVVISSINFPGSSAFSRGVAYYYTVDNFVFNGGLGLSPYGLRMHGASYITVTNSTFQDYSSEPPNPWDWWHVAGMSIINNAWTACSRITVSNCAFIRNTHGMATIGSAMLTNSLIENTVFDGNDFGYLSTDWGTRYTTFSKCTFSNNGTGILLEGVYWYWLKTHTNTIHRCVFANNGRGVFIGDETASTHSACSYNNHVINSTFYGNTGSGIVVNTNFNGSNDYTPEYLDSRGQTFANNIFLGNGAYGIDNVANQTLYAGYSLAYNNALGAGNNAVIDASNNSLTVDPQLVNPAGGNFALDSSSVCIEAGDPAYDSDPDVVGDHIDIGALEYNNPSPVAILETLIDGVDDIPESFLKNKNNSLPLSKKLYVAITMVMRGDEEVDTKKQSNYYHSALQKLQNDILPKTDGCATSGAPDANDWILDCATQEDFHGPIAGLIAMLSAMP